MFEHTCVEGGVIFSSEITQMEISDVSMHGLPQNPEFCFQAVMSISGNSDFFFFFSSEQNHFYFK